MDRQKEIEEMAKEMRRPRYYQGGERMIMSMETSAMNLIDAGYGNVKEYQEEIIDLAARLDVAEQDKSNLERTILDMSEALSDNGIYIDVDGNVNVKKVQIEVLENVMKRLHAVKDAYPSEDDAPVCACINDIYDFIQEIRKDEQ